MAGFVQIIEFTTTRIDELKKLSDDYRAARTAAGDVPVIRSTVTADRDRPNTYRNIVEFSSYDDAMANSQNPATGEFAQQMMALCDGPPTFYNLDVLDVAEFAGT
jgi:hypothetical protein